tara:strand:- start:6417 stop:6614 length:198 start_codon:yes stop_codon:yes gene_type:complete
MSKIKKLELTTEEWDLLAKNLSSIINKSVILIEKPLSPKSRVSKTEQLKDKALECFDIIRHKTIK